MNSNQIFKRLVLLLFLTFLTLNCASRKNTNIHSEKTAKIRLKWKIDKNQKILYETVMNDIVDPSYEMNFGGVFDKLLDSTPVEKDVIKGFFNKFKNIFNDSKFITTLANSDYFENVIDVTMTTKPKGDKKNDDDDGDVMSKMMESMTTGVMLRGSLYKDGGLQSFWVKNAQKNLVSLFFELPDKDIAIGDTWTLKNINFLQFDQNFVCDKALKKNLVTLTDIIEENGDKIALINYDIFEYVHGVFKSPFQSKEIVTEMKMVYKAQAKFSINKGRWISYAGIMSIDATGIMNSEQKKKFALIEISE